MKRDDNMMDLTALLRQEIDLSGLMLTRKQKQIIQYIFCLLYTSRCV